MARDALTVAAQDAANIEPTPQPVEDDHLVPERPLGIDNRDVGDGEITARKIIIHIGGYCPHAVRI